jgi:hypothetical protein
MTDRNLYDTASAPSWIAPERVPLYLAPEGETWVGLDGPVLRVSQPQRADRLFPLRRLSRVLTSTRADWEQDALLACAESGIPVLFCDDDGQVIARLLGRPGERDELKGRLVSFLLRAEAGGMLDFWIGQSRHRAARWAAIKLGIPPASRGAGEVRRRIHRTAERLAGAEAALDTRQRLRALAYAWMEEHLSDLGFGRSTELAQIGAPDLAAELTGVLYWYLEPARIGWLRRRRKAAQRKGEPVRAPTRREIVRLFQSRATRVATRGREVTGALHRWLIHET